MLNPSIEERIFFQSEVKCEIVRNECKYFVPGVGPMEEFVIVGKGAFDRDQTLLDECEAAGLIELEKNGR